MKSRATLTWVTRRFARNPASPELAAALSWLARANLEAKNLDQADAFAAEAGKMASRFLIGQKLDDDPWLPTAVGASIEIHAQVLAARGERAEAIDYLRSQLKQFAGTSLPERIHKNINLLGLEGKPAPPLDLTAAQWLGATPPRSPRCVDTRSYFSSGRTGAATAKPKWPSWPISGARSPRKGWLSSDRLGSTGMSPVAKMRRPLKRSPISRRFVAASMPRYPICRYR